MIVSVQASLKVTPTVAADLSSLRDILAGRMPTATCVVDNANGWVLVTFSDASETV